LRSTPPACEILSRDHTFPTASNALVPCRQMSVCPTERGCQTPGGEAVSTHKFVGTARGL